MAQSPGQQDGIAGESTSLELGLIGNCQIAALVDRESRLVWGCFPRMDGDPLFSRLIDDRDEGYFAIELIGLVESRQYYRRNTAILCTELTDRDGNCVRITDFAPRFRQYGRHFRPVTLVRQVELVDGAPMIRMKLRPGSAYGAERPSVTRGSNHVRYLAADQVLRVTTDASLTYLIGEQPLIVERTLTFLLGADESVPSSVAQIGREFRERTRGYWQDWVRSLAIPFDWQPAVIRAAIALKLCTFEDTGAVLAALTTSIPEASDSGRNWDYRYCWLRDAYFVVHALNRLGATRTMEGFLHYIINLVSHADDYRLQPLYGIGAEHRLDERELDSLAGYRGMGPVRVGNAAYRQCQHDVYGAVVLAATQAFFDQRLGHDSDHALFARLEPLGEEAARRYDQPDAGIWEYRGRRRVHTYSSVMCWAACDRLARIAAHLGFVGRERHWRECADAMHAEITRRAWNERLGAFVESFEGEHIDASMLLLHELGFLPASDTRFVATVEAVERHLRRGDHVFRYAAADDFGTPENAFNICTFWFVDALAAIGRRDEARRLFENMLGHRTALGLMSEDLDPASGELWGNFPQTYSLVGLINTALHLSRTWEEAI